MTHFSPLARRLAVLCSAVVIASLLAGAALAGPIERACNKSERKAANRALCNCVQRAADSSLSNRDQRRAASFFKDPEKAHKVWMSKTKSDDAFWDRYKAFGAAAEAMCGGGGNTP
ncbi:hypothetical protein [Tabrizicola sp.]|uniref:hypothetical protein n=1 Tax=Tabrizicola sp. TaxID=2005166 RepID=UPI003D29AEBE